MIKVLRVGALPRLKCSPSRLAPREIYLMAGYHRKFWIVGLSLMVFAGASAFCLGSKHRGRSHKPSSRLMAASSSTVSVNGR